MDLPPPIGPKPRPRGTTVLFIILGILGAGMLTCGAAIYVFLRSESGQKLVEGAREVAGAIEASQNAPGAEEIRALGCDTVFVLEIERMRSLLEVFLSEEQLSRMDAEFDPSTPMVFCQVPKLELAPSCSDIARIYSDASQPEGGFLVDVRVAGRTDDYCSAEYTAAGDLIRKMEADQ